MDAMDTDERREMTHKIMNHALRLAETASLPPGSQIRTFTSQCCVSLNIPPTALKSNAIKTKEAPQPQEESHISVLYSFTEPPTYDAQFAVRHCYKSISCPLQ